MALAVFVIILALGFIALVLWLNHRWMDRHEQEFDHRLLGLPDDLPPEINRKFLIENPERLSNLCPPEFLRKRENGVAWAFALKFVLLCGFFLVTALLKNAGILIMGIPLDKLFFGALCGLSTVSTGRRAIAYFAGYAIRLNLGENPLNSQQARHQGQIFGVAFLMGGLWMAANLRGMAQIMLLVTLLEVVLMGLLFRKNIIMTEKGILFHHYMVPWGKVGWYRWYDHGEGILVGLDSSRYGTALMVFPVNEQTTDDVTDILERFAPDKGLAEIRTDWHEASVTENDVAARNLAEVPG